MMGPRDLALFAARVLERAGADYFVTGSMGAMVYGEYRSTLDVGVVVNLRYGHLPDLKEAFSEPDFYMSMNAVHEAMTHCSQFNVIHRPTGLKVDFMVADESPCNASRFRRARSFEAIPGESFKVAAPDDLILKKLEYYTMGGSDKHLRDIASMIKVSGETFDRAYLERWAEALDVTEAWTAVKQRIGW